MPELKLKLPYELEKRMEKFGWADWQKIAVKSLSEKIDDFEEFETERKIAEISEISPGDKREVRESVAREVIASIDETAEALKSGKIKSMTLDEFNKWCDEL